MTNNLLRVQARGKMVMHQERLKKIHIKAGLLLGSVQQEVDTLIGEDFMDKDLTLVKTNTEELIRLQKEAKLLSEKIDQIKSVYGFEDEDLEF
jgi:hypothetical protein